MPTNEQDAQEFMATMQAMHELINKDLCETLMAVVNTAVDKGGDDTTHAHLIATAAHLVSNLLYHGGAPTHEHTEQMTENVCAFITTCVAGFQLQDQSEQDDNG